MVRDVDLIKYLPLFVAEYEEIQEITESENPEFRLAIKKVSQAKENQFIISADEDGISRFERLLGIRPKDKSSLEDRRKEILARWNDVSVYTYKGLILRLNQLLGVGNYEIYPNFDDYQLELEYRNKSGFESYIREIIPANITLKTQLALVSNTNLFSASIAGELIIISEPKPDDIESKMGDGFKAIGISGELITIADPFSNFVEIKQDLPVKSANSGTSEVIEIKNTEEV